VDLGFVSSSVIQIKLSLALTVSRSQYSLFLYSKSVVHLKKNSLMINELIILIKFFNCLIFHCCARGMLWPWQKFWQYIKYVICDSPPPSFSFIPLPLFLEYFQKVSFFYSHTRVHSVWPYSPSYTLSPCPLLTGTNPPVRTCSALLFSDFVKQMTFLFG
jgi:hypothetical protein